jgi:hypothetical protein
LEFVNGVREKVEVIGYEMKAYFMRKRPTFVDGRVMIRADCRSKEGGTFEYLACQRLSPFDRTKWECISGFMEPEWTVGKEKYKKKTYKQWETGVYECAECEKNRSCKIWN